jgi:hypothetical protein
VLDVPGGEFLKKADAVIPQFDENVVLGCRLPLELFDNELGVAAEKDLLAL